MGDVLRHLLRRFGRPSDHVVRSADEHVYDERLTRLEQTQREIVARLSLLERQADPRGMLRREDTPDG